MMSAEWGMIREAVQYGARVTPEDVARLVANNGGATISNDWRIAGGGWLVGLEGFGEVLPELDAHSILRYMEKYNPAFMGLWRNPETGNIFLDTIQIVDDKRDAIALGIENNQLAIYNDLTGEEIDIRNYYPMLGLASVRTAGGKSAGLGELGQYSFQIQRARGWAASQGAVVAPEETNWVALSFVRLGASVEENAKATYEELLGNDPGLRKNVGDHKPARPDIQKYKDAWEAENAAFNDNTLLESLEHADDQTKAPSYPARQEWEEKYEPTDMQNKLVNLYQYLYNNESGPTYHDPQASFEQTVQGMLTREWHDEVKDGADPNIDPDEARLPEMKKELGAALKKYELKRYPIMYQSIKRALDDAYRRSVESYKLWPWMVAQLKERLKEAVNTGSIPITSSSQLLHGTQHLVDIVTEAGPILNKLRAENKIPQNFDVNKMNLDELEQWLMDWKRENREAESQGEVVYEFHDGSTIQKLTTPEQLQFEGDEMGHCVGGYAHSVEQGDSIIYSLRDKKGMPHVTMEIEGMEAYRRGRDVPEMGSAETPEEIKEVADENGIDLYEPPHDPQPHVMEMLNPTDHEPGQHTQQITDGYGLNKDNDYGWGKTGQKPFQVVQVQGKGNNTPKPEYQHKIKEFLDYLRSKGWNFERSENWYGNWDENEDENQYHFPARDYYNRDGGAVLARHLDDWYDEHYKDQHHRYVGAEGTEDAYGMPQQPLSLHLGHDWEDLFQDCLGALVDDYDPGRFRGNWENLAQAVWHAWQVEGDYHFTTPQHRKREADAFQKELEKADEKLMEWVDQMWWNAQSYQSDEIANNIRGEAEVAGKLDEIEEKLDEIHGDGEWNDEDFSEYVRDEEPEIWEEAETKARDQIENDYAGDAYKFLSYLNMLLGKTGLTETKNLPDPKQRHGGLPSYEELQEMPWKAETNTPSETIPGTFSSWHEAVVDIGKCGFCGNSIGADGYCMVCGRFNNEFNRPQRVPRGMPVQQQPNPNDAWVPYQPQTEKMPGTFASMDDQFPANHEFRIVPINRDNNLYFDEDGNQRPRYRNTWVRGENGKMEQTGPEEDSFLDKQGRQGEGYLAYHGDRPIGSLTYVDDPAGWYMLGTAYTHPEFRQRGVFNKLVQPLRDSGKPIDGYVWNNPWLRDKVRSWQKTADYELGGHDDPQVNVVRPENLIEVPESSEDRWERQRREDEELRAEQARLPAPTIHWVNNDSPYEYSHAEAPDYGLPFLWHPRENTVYLGTHPTFHSDIESAHDKGNSEIDVPYGGAHGRFNHLRHQPSEGYNYMWRDLPPACKDAIDQEIWKKYPETVDFGDNQEDEDGGWDEMF